VNDLFIDSQTDESDLDLEGEAFDAWNAWLDESGLTVSDAPFHAFVAGVEWAEECYRALLAARG
jgi:hypothetical protein